ncbi:LysM peptidoglycan-binding domain-containing protein [Pontibacter cellulosilyticus]|uniref:LysM peptidoglycan-binding domain-containing protein n=1 Tax=Pontibacter cellulosilyticus TaxID=1720253 RepID=A0A923N4M4_9BACT|nr:LysM peptidoglycan-binding domain-containing protein [Pontibacter cellulosilyticus]MBC5992820.1 LysM peptidoglycan-binding domain-containing protein [Pontibacter cellulosilyticus]
MGLRDFFKKGKEEPAKEPTKYPGTPGQQGQPHDFFSQSDKNKVTDPGLNQDVYTVQSGDSLSKIAKKHYGNANAWTKIYNANKDKIGDNPDLIRPGQRFVIPRD